MSVADRGMGIRVSVLAVGDVTGEFPDVDIQSVDSVAAARECIASGLDGIDGVVSEYALPDGTGFDVFAAVRERIADHPCLLVTDREPRLLDTDPGTPLVEYVPREIGSEAIAKRLRTAVETATHAGCPVPDDERDRLAVVERLDRDADVGALADRAARAFGVSLAGVGIVEHDRYRPLAIHGGDAVTVTRSDVPCAYAILDDGTFVIDDLHDDPRFAGPPAFCDDDLSWYAVEPILVGGQPVGTVFLYDVASRGLDGADCDRLRLLAREAADRLAADE